MQVGDAIVGDSGLVRESLVLMGDVGNYGAIGGGGIG